MIVDVHYHLLPFLDGAAREQFLDNILKYARQNGIELDPVTVSSRLDSEIIDPLGEKLLSSMENAGIDVTVICAVDNGISRGVTAEMMQANNKYLTEVAHRYPGRVFALAGVDPRRPEATEMTRQCLGEFGAIGIKYHPNQGYHPAGIDSRKILSIINYLGGILLTHTGTTRMPVDVNYAEPKYLAEIKNEFPKIRLIAAHTGMEDWHSWIDLTAGWDNLYGDMAGWDDLAFSNFEAFCRRLRGVIDGGGLSRILFGTDNPRPTARLVRGIHPTREYIQLIKSLPLNSSSPLSFTESEISAIMGDNAADLLGLTKAKN